MKFQQNQSGNTYMSTYNQKCGKARHVKLKSIPSNAH